MQQQDKKQYSHHFVENNKYSFWKENNLFELDPSRSKAQKFSIILPPPNITGQLHLGHALNTTIQDVLIRYKKINGFNTVWLPGTDHAGIATQTKFDKVLKEQKIDKSNWSKEKYLSELKVWAESQKEYIHSQWAKMGLALAYNNETFTLDENVKELVAETFVKLFKQKLIYQDYKLVNWDVKLQTAVSDIEVIHKPTKSKLYYFRYYLENNPSKYLVIATTRPETMFGDTHIFVNPKDERYKEFINKKAYNPVNNELLTILSDRYIDIKFGTGVMKCTPAHDFNDYNLAKTHKITNYHSIMNNDGTLNEFCKVDDVSYQGMDRLVARDKIVEQLRQKGLVEKIEDYDNEVGYSERTNEVIEPLLSKQWFVNMKPIVKELKAELAKKTTIFNFYPTRFKSTLNKWLDNLDDWCISRQLLWGHQLPVYYHKDTNKMYVGINPPVDYIHEQSVLDTWFSSGLWPIATTIKNHNPNVKNFYPTSVLVTAYDIIFFWVARMLFQCVNIKHQIPFNTVLVHGIIRDSQNRKMSKSLGNGINPLDLIEKYGADALRLFLIGSSTLGEDIRFNEERLTFYTNFLNKIWNAHNFLNGHESVLKVDAKSIDVSSLHPINKWILAKFNDLLKDVTKMFDKYNFAVLVKNLVTFIWDVYCNEYLELTHSLFSSKEYWKQTALVSHYIFKSLLIVLHPFAPFITEQLYLTMYKDKMSIMLETMPEIIKITGSKQSYNIDHFLITIAKVRELRIKYKIKNSTIININLIIHNKVNEKMVKDLFMLQNIKVNEISNKRINEEWDIIETQDIIIEYLNEFVNKDEELARLLKQKQNLENEIKRSENILSNKNFIAKASKEKVESEKNKYEQYKKQYEIVANSIKRLQK